MALRSQPRPLHYKMQNGTRLAAVDLGSNSFQAGNRTGRPRSDSPHRIPQGDGAPGQRPGQRPQPHARGHAAGLGRARPVWRAAGRLQALAGAGRGHANAARSPQPRRISFARTHHPGVRHRRDSGSRGSPPHLPRRGAHAAAHRCLRPGAPPGGGHRRALDRNDHRPGARGRAHGVLPRWQRRLVDEALCGRPLHPRRIPRRRGGRQGRAGRCAFKLHPRPVGRGLRRLRHHRRGGRRAGRGRRRARADYPRRARLAASTACSRPAAPTSCASTACAKTANPSSAAA